MDRRHDWPDQLAALIRNRRQAPFVWGSNDCMVWAADCVLAQTGVDTLAEYRGQYSTAIGALKALRRIGGHDAPQDLADALWGPRVHIAQAKLGDVVMAAVGEPEGFGMSAGICYGRNSLFVGTEAGQPGLVTLDTLTLEHCYQPWASSSKA